MSRGRVDLTDAQVRWCKDEVKQGWPEVGDGQPTGTGQEPSRLTEEVSKPFENEKRPMKTRGIASEPQKSGSCNAPPWAVWQSMNSGAKAMRKRTRTRMMAGERRMQGLPRPNTSPKLKSTKPSGTKRRRHSHPGPPTARGAPCSLPPLRRELSTSVPMVGGGPARLAAANAVALPAVPLTYGAAMMVDVSDGKMAIVTAYTRKMETHCRHIWRISPGKPSPPLGPAGDISKASDGARVEGALAACTHPDGASSAP